MSNTTEPERVAALMSERTREQMLLRVWRAHDRAALFPCWQLMVNHKLELAKRAIESRLSDATILRCIDDWICAEVDAATYDSPLGLAVKLASRFRRAGQVAK
jgi:hypothetical protein